MTAAPTHPPEITLSPAEVGRAVVSSAMSVVDEPGAVRVTREGHWKSNFTRHLVALDTAVAAEPARGADVAAAGLRAAHELITADGAFTRSGRRLGTTTLRGTKPRATELAIPYRGRHLQGQELLDEVNAWVARGLCSPTVPAAIEQVILHPEWLSLEGDTVVVLGAMSKIGPYWPLLRWGATVAAVDLPTARTATALQFRAMESAGTALLPTGDHEVPGVDVAVEFDALGDWLEGLDGRLVLANTLRGAPDQQFLLAMTADALTARLLRTRPGTAIADMASPADSFAVTERDVAHSRDAYSGSSRRLRGIARAVTQGHALQPNYPRNQAAVVADAHLPQHSWDFTMAKRISRWRAVDAAAHGVPVSHNVAPATFQAPMRSHALSQMVIRSAARFGIEPFEERTAQKLMAALLVHDLRSGGPAAASVTDFEHRNAIHAGLWTSPYKPRSVIGLVGGSQPTSDTLELSGS